MISNERKGDLRLRKTAMKTFSSQRLTQDKSINEHFFEQSSTNRHNVANGTPIRIMCGAATLLSIVFYLILSQMLYSLRYTMFWNGQYDDTLCHRKIPTASDPIALQREYDCHQSAARFLNHVDNTPTEDTSDKMFSEKMCTVITTTHRSDQSAARNELDYFNVTLSSLVHAYNLYQEFNGNGGSVIKDHIIVLEYVTSPEGIVKESYKQRLVEGIPGLEYYQNIKTKSYEWHRRGVEHALDALTLCKTLDEKVEFALVLEDDVLIGDDLFFDLKGIVHVMETKHDWFYVKLFHSEYWEGWSNNVMDNLCLILVFASSIGMFHGVLSLYTNNVNRLFRDWRHTHNRKQITLVGILYSWIGISCVWFIVGMGKQNIWFYADHHIFGEQKLLLPIEDTGAAGALANLYNLEYALNAEEFYNERINNDRTYTLKTGTDIVVRDFSKRSRLSDWTYFPSLVQHMGRASSSTIKNSKCELSWMKESMTFRGSTLCGNVNHK